MKKYTQCTLLCLFVTSTVYAQQTKYYVGASYLDAKTDFMGETDNDSGGEARVGYIINNHLSFEANYSDFGTLELSKIADAGGSVKSDGYSIAAIGAYPIGQFKVIGKVGYLWWKSEGTLGSIAGPAPFTFDGSDMIIGAGVAYSITNNIDIKLEYDDSQRFSWGSIGVNYQF